MSALLQARRRSEVFFCVETGGLYQIEAAVLFDGVCNLFYNNCFIFLLHCESSLMG